MGNTPINLFSYPSPSPQVIHVSIPLPTSAISFLSLTAMMGTKAGMKGSSSKSQGRKFKSQLSHFLAQYPPTNNSDSFHFLKKTKCGGVGQL